MSANDATRKFKFVKKLLLVSWNLQNQTHLFVGLGLLSSSLKSSKQSFVGSHSQQYRPSPQSRLVICGTGEDNLFSSLS